MAVEPTTYGFPGGSIDAAAIPEWVKTARARFSVSGPDDWKVSPLGSLDRGIRVEVGTGHGDGVTVKTHEYETMSLPYPDIATRWYLIARRRNWAGTGTATLVALPAGATPSLPAVGNAATQMKNKPGVESDQPIALVPVTQKDRTVGTGIIDLRAWAGPGGVEAVHSLALSYLAEPGAAVKLGGTVWRYELQANNVWDWSDGRGVKVPVALTYLYSADPPRGDRLQQEAPSVYRDGHRVHLSGVASNIGKVEYSGFVEYSLGRLPAGFRPALVEYFTIESAFTLCRVWVRPDGNIYFMFPVKVGPLASRLWRFSLSGISFDAA